MKNFLIDKPNDFIDKNQISYNKINNVIKKFKKTNVAVFGDIIVDQYIDCSPEGLSREETAIVINKNQENKYIGGASIVSAHVSSLGANVEFFSVAGNDSDYKFIKKKCLNIP